VAPIYFLVFFAVSLRTIAFRGRPPTAGLLYRGALLLAALPYLLHVRYTWGWVSGFGDPQPRIGVYPGLVAFAIAGVVTTVALVAVAWVLVPRVPFVTAALPPTLWLLYWFVTLRLAYWRAPDFVPIDNKPLIWLFGFSAVATVLLASSAWIGLARPASRQRGASPPEV